MPEQQNQSQEDKHSSQRIHNTGREQQVEATSSHALASNQAPADSPAQLPTADKAGSGSQQLQSPDFEPPKISTKSPQPLVAAAFRSPLTHTVEREGMLSRAAAIQPLTAADSVLHGTGGQHETLQAVQQTADLVMEESLHAQKNQSTDRGVSAQQLPAGPERNRNDMEIQRNGSQGSNVELSLAGGVPLGSYDSLSKQTHPLEAPPGRAQAESAPSLSLAPAKASAGIPVLPAILHDQPLRSEPPANAARFAQRKGLLEEIRERSAPPPQQKAAAVPQQPQRGGHDATEQPLDTRGDMAMEQRRSAAAEAHDGALGGGTKRGDRLTLRRAEALACQIALTVVDINFVCRRIEGARCGRYKTRTAAPNRRKQGAEAARLLFVRDARQPPPPQLCADAGKRRCQGCATNTDPSAAADSRCRRSRTCKSAERPCVQRETGASGSQAY